MHVILRPIARLNRGRRNSGTSAVRTLLFACCWWCLNTTVTSAQIEPTVLTASITEPTTEQEDATLRDVVLVGQSGIWAVGDHGAVWKSEDAGSTWKFLAVSPLLDRYSLHSVCFLTDRVGWIVGGTILPVGGTPVGVMLATRDGGLTWTVERNQNLPYLKYVRFFDLENGVAAGDRSTAFPTGVLQTSDGGQHWTPVTSPHSGRWNAAAFTSPQNGIVAGAAGLQGVIAGGALTSSSSGTRGLRAFQGVSLDAGGRGWLAGDGSFLFRTENAGVSWTPIHSRLPLEIDDFSSFHSVAHLGDQAWVAGSPGTVIWHTSDAGNTWSAQRTNDAIPLEVIRFATPERGVAAGQLGRICVTQDGGQTWHPVRGQGRRLTCLAVQTHAEQTAVPFLTRWAKEEGYRSAVLISTRRDMGEDAHAARQLDVRLAHAVQAAGGARGMIDWRLPIGLPNLENDREKLIREWTLMTDKRLAEVILKSLVAEIRIWRPAVLLIDEPAPGEFAADLIQRAVTKAMDQAADPTIAIDQQQLAGLAPWSVKKLVVQKRTGDRGVITLDPQEVLPHLGKTLELAALDGLAQLHLDRSATLRKSEYVILKTAAGETLSDRNIFGDLAIAPGSDARRALTTITSIDYDRLVTEANHRRTITAISERASASPLQAGRLLGQLKEMIAPLSPEQAALQLASMGQMYHTRGEWSLAESVYVELIARYPEQPAAVNAMLWLMQYWTSAEMNWQRLRTMQATGTIIRGGGGMDSGVAQAKLEEAIQTFRNQPTRTAAALATPALSAPRSSETQPLALANGSMQTMLTSGSNSGNQYEGQLQRWQASALAVANGMKDTYPQVFEQPQMQFLLAALHRRRSNFKKSDEIYSEFMKSLGDDPWNVAARGEIYLIRPGAQSPKPVAICKTVRQPPILDGILSDDCWREAMEIRLGDKTSSEVFIGSETQVPGTTSRVGAQAVVLLAHDDQFLYVAASVPVHAELPAAAPERSGRQHDADLDLFDRICLQFDVDRDYGTYYQFEIDQRGQTRDSCWDNAGYNPKWFCATTREIDAWRLECAIPLEELLPPERIVGTSWSVGITRILPGLGAQSWTGSGANRSEPARFGLVRFE